MRKFYKRFTVIVSLILGLSMPMFMSMTPAAAITIVPNCGSGSAGGKPAVCKDLSSGAGSTNPIISVIKAAISILSYIVGVAAVIGIVASGIRMIASGGDPNAISSARSGLLYSLVGVVVVILAQIIVVFVLDKLKNV